MRSRPGMSGWFVIAIAIATMAGTAQAQEADCQPVATTRSANADGSTLSVRTECPGDGRRVHVVELACRDGRRCDETRIEQDLMETPMGHASLVDLEGDGMHEVEVRGMCGAGPNCEGDVHRIDPASHRLVHFFTGGYADLSVQDGWLVEAGRASCCSWEFHAWRLDGTHALPLQYDNMDLMVKVDAAAGLDGDDEEAAGVACTFLRPAGDNARVVAPPTAALERLCGHYGEPYRLTPPDTTPGAP